MNKNQDFNKLLKQALNEYTKQEFEDDKESIAEFKTSKKYEKKIKKLMKSQHNIYHKATLTKARKTVCILVAVLILTVSLLSVGAVRQMIANLFVDSHKSYDTVTPATKKKPYPKKIKIYYYLSSIPNGYEQTDKIKTTTESTTMYLNSKGDYVMFSQTTMDSYSMNVDTSHSTRKNEVINGQDCLIYMYTDKSVKTPVYTFVWNDGEYIFNLISTLPENTMLDICKSIKAK